MLAKQAVRKTKTLGLADLQVPQENEKAGAGFREGKIQRRGNNGWHLRCQLFGRGKIDVKVWSAFLCRRSAHTLGFIENLSDRVLFYGSGGARPCPFGQGKYLGTRVSSGAG